MFLFAMFVTHFRLWGRVKWREKASVKKVLYLIFIHFFIFSAAKFSTGGIIALSVPVAAAIVVQVFEAAVPWMTAALDEFWLPE